MFKKERKKRINPPKPKTIKGRKKKRKGEGEGEEVVAFLLHLFIKGGIKKR